MSATPLPTAGRSLQIADQVNENFGLEIIIFFYSFQYYQEIDPNELRPAISVMLRGSCFSWAKSAYSMHNKLEQDCDDGAPSRSTISLTHSRPEETTGDAPPSGQSAPAVTREPTESVWQMVVADLHLTYEEIEDSA